MDDLISRQDAINCFFYKDGYFRNIRDVVDDIRRLPSAQHKCKDCKWWKDSDGVYRRGVFAESRCPINSRKVYEGDGYCYIFEPQERND